jgi:hypothetical protein
MDINLAKATIKHANEIHQMQLIAFKNLLEKYNPKEGWCFDTILQEEGNCYLYEKNNIGSV